MSIARTEHADGSWEVKATGKDCAQLKGCFAETNAKEREKRVAEERSNRSRKIRRRDGSVIDVPGRMVEGQIAKGRALADPKIASVMPRQWFAGYAADGRIAYDEPGTSGEWELVATVPPNEGEGWARKEAA